MKKGLVLSALLFVIGFALLGSSQVYPFTLWPGEGGGSGGGPAWFSFFYQPGATQLVLGTALILIGSVGLLVSGLRSPAKRKKH